MSGYHEFHALCLSEDITYCSEEEYDCDDDQKDDGDNLNLLPHGRSIL